MKVCLRIYNTEESESKVNDFLDVLSADERVRASSFHSQVHRTRFIVGRFFLRTVLAEETGLNAASIRFEATELGKPAMVNSNCPSIRFSFARSENFSACATCSDPSCRSLGFDIESNKQLDDMENLAETIFHAADLAVWRRLNETERYDTFFRAWTRKEALGKALGTGISTGPENLAVPIDSFPANTALAIDHKDGILFSDWDQAPENLSASLAILGTNVDSCRYQDSDSSECGELNCQLTTRCFQLEDSIG